MISKIDKVSNAIKSIKSYKMFQDLEEHLSCLMIVRYDQKYAHPIIVHSHKYFFDKVSRLK